MTAEPDIEQIVEMGALTAVYQPIGSSILARSLPTKRSRAGLASPRGNFPMSSSELPPIKT